MLWLIASVVFLMLCVLAGPTLLLSKRHDVSTHHWQLTQTGMYRSATCSGWIQWSRAGWVVLAPEGHPCCTHATLRRAQRAAGARHMAVYRST